NLDQLATAAKQHDGTKLRVNATAENQFIPGAADHGLHGDSLEMLAPGFGRHSLLNVRVCAANCFFRLQIELHTADISFVCDGFGQQLQYDGETDLPCCRNGVVLRMRCAGRYYRNSV